MFEKKFHIITINFPILNYNIILRIPISKNLISNRSSYN